MLSCNYGKSLIDNARMKAEDSQESMKTFWMRIQLRILHIFLIKDNIIQISQYSESLDLTPCDLW